LRPGSWHLRPGGARSLDIDIHRPPGSAAVVIAYVGKAERVNVAIASRAKDDVPAGVVMRGSATDSSSPEIEFDEIATGAVSRWKKLAAGHL